MKKSIIVSVNVKGGAKAELYDLCIKTQNLYAKKYGIDFEVIDKILSEKSTNENKTIALKQNCFYTKIKVLDYLKDYEQVLYLDSDIMILRDAENIFESYTNKSCFYGRQIHSEKPLKIIQCYLDKYKIEWERIRGYLVMYNGGVMLIGNKCDIVGYEKEYIIDSGTNDEGYFGYLIQKNKIENYDIGPLWNCTRKTTSDEEIYSKAYFLHYSGAGFATKAGMDKHFCKVLGDYNRYGLRKL